MEIFLLKVDGVWKGQRFGPYSVDQVRKNYADGDFTDDDLAFFEGCDGWVPIAHIDGVGPDHVEESDDPEVDQERQRELAEMFPDPEDDFFDDDEEDGYEEKEDLTQYNPPPATSPVASESPASSSAVEPVPVEQSKVEEASSPTAKSATEAVAESSEKPLAESGGGQGRRFSLSKAQAAMHKKGGNRRGQRRGGIPLPPRPGMGAFGWVIFLSLLFGIGASMTPQAGPRSGIPDFAQLFGRFHPILVHLPVGALLLALPMHLCDRPGLFRHVGAGSTFVLWFAMVSSVLAVFTGFFSSYTAVAAGGIERDLDVLNLHVTTSVLLGSGACASLFLKLFSRRFAEAWLHHLCSAVLLATVIALLYSVHTGTLLTHGNDFMKQPEDEPAASPPEGNSTPL
ncbi:MAG: GYF domain-containing protein [Opitutales bacterium]